jgi:hypothetical protein
MCTNIMFVSASCARNVVCIYEITKYIDELNSEVMFDQLIERNHKLHRYKHTSANKCETLLIVITLHTTFQHL